MLHGWDQPRLVLAQVCLGTVFLLCMSTSEAAVTLLNGPNIQSGYSAEEKDDDNPNFSYTVNVPAGAQLAVVGVTNRNHRKASATLGGAAMTEVVDLEGYDQRAQLLVLVNPAAGNQTIAFTFSNNTRAETSGVYFFTGVDTDDLLGLNAGWPKALGAYATDPSVTFTGADAPPAGSAVVSLVSTKDNMGSAALSGGGTKNIGYRRWPEWRNWLGTVREINGGAMGIVTGLNGGALTTGWDIPGSGTMGALILRPASAAPSDISPNTLSVNDNDPSGTLVGTLTVTDADGEAPYTWTLVDNAGGRFSLAASTGPTVQVLIANAGLINRGDAASHAIAVQVGDKATYNANYSETLNIAVIDTTPPIATNFTGTPPFAKTGDVVTISAIVTDNVALSGTPGMTVNGDNLGAPVSVSGSLYTYSYTVPAGAIQGSATVVVNVMDTAGNTATPTSATAFVIDNTPPTISGFASTPPFARPGTLAVIDVDISDSSGIQGNPEMTVNGLGAGVPVEVTGATYSYNFVLPAGAPDGIAAISVSAYDRAGNRAVVSAPAVLTIDGTAPVISDIVCPDTPAQSGTAVDIQVRVVEANGLAVSPEMSVNGVDAGTPVSVSGDTYTYHFNIPLSTSDGFASIVVNARDKAGNTASLPSNTALYFDNTAPNIQSIAASPSLAAAGHTVTVSCTITDASELAAPPTLSVSGMNAGGPSQISGDTYTWEYIVPAGIVNGPATLTIQATDTADNAATRSENGLLTLDTTGPAITAIAATPSPAKAGDAITIAFNASDAYGPLAGNPTVSVNGTPTSAPVSVSGNSYQYAYTVPAGAPNGWASVQIQAQDTVGNVTNTAASNVLLIDTVPPVVTNIQANPDVVKDGDLVKITFAAADVTTAVQAHPTVTVNGRAATYYNKAGSAYEYRYTIDGDVDLDGPAPIVIVARDTVGNMTTRTSNDALLIDSTVPTISALSAYPLYATHGDTVTIAFTVNDNNGLPDNPVVTVNGNEARFTIGVGGSYEYSYLIDQDVDIDGPADISVTAIDVLGNEGHSQSNGLLIIDTTPPTGSLSINGGAAITRTSDVTLTLVAEDGPVGTGVDVVRYSDDGLNWTQWEAPTATRAWQLPGTQGYHLVYAELRDRTGNRSAEPLIAQIALAPNTLTVTVDGGTEKSAMIGEDITIEVTVTGAFGQVQYEWLRLEGGQWIPVGEGLQGPVFVIEETAMDDTGIYACRVSDELDTRSSADIHVDISAPVPAMSWPMRLLLAALLAALGALALRRKAVALVMLAVLLMPVAQAQPVAPYGAGATPQYTIIYGARVDRTDGSDRSDEALEALARERGSVELVQGIAAPGVPRKLLRLGEPGVGMPGFTSYLREELAKAAAASAPTMLKDGRESYSVDIEGRSTLVFRLPKKAGAQDFEAVLYSKDGEAKMTERRTETYIDGVIRPLMIRLDHEEGSLIQVFEYRDTPVSLEKAAELVGGEVKAVRYDTLSAEDLARMAAAQPKADEPVDRMVQFIVPPQGMENLGFDSGWVPSGGTGEPGGFIVQIRLNIGAGFNYDANVGGQFILQTDDRLSAGTASGHWAFYFGAVFFLKAAFDIPIPGFDPFVVDIPYVPDFEMVASDRDDFDSYLLDETSTLHNESIRQQVVDLNIIELLITQGIIDLPSWIPLPGIGVRLDVAPVADGHLTCNSIDLSDGNSFTTEGQSLPITIPPAGYRADVVYNEDAELNIGAKVYPRIFIGIGSLWSYEWPSAEDEENVLNQLQWLPIALDSFPFSDSELNFTGEPSTGDPTDWFTQHFTLSNNNLSFKRVLFTPNFSNNYYVACVDTAAEYRTNPYEGTPVTLGDNDYVQVNLQDGKKVNLYGQQYSSFFIGSNGYITFTQGDTDDSPSLDDHFDLPRISALYTNMKPNEGGQVLWKQYTNRVVVTWNDVILTDIIDARTASCQIEMFFDGRIVITWLNLELYGGLVGLSRGTGTPADFQKSIFSNYPQCFGVLPDEGAIRVFFDPAQVLTKMPRWRLDDGEWRESGEMEAAAVGIHTLNFNAVDGWAPPPARQVVFTKDYLLETRERWTRQTGTVEIHTSPAYAQWSFVDGDGQSHSGAGTTFVYEIPTGEITITWPPLATFEQPVPSVNSAVLYPNSSVRFNGNYPPIIGLGHADLRVSIEPKKVRDAGAQWRFNGGAWNDSGTQLTVADGDAVISFKPIYGWAAPEDDARFIERDTIHDLSYDYVRQRGTVVIEVDPEGAPWAVIDGDGKPHTGWGDSTLPDLPTGPIQVIWGHVNTYNEPDPNPYPVELLPGDTLTVVGSWIPVLGEGEGLLSVVIEPAAARNAGAQWRVTGGEWHDSGAMVALPDGEHLVKFKPQDGWIVPLDTMLMVNRGITNVYPFTYARQGGIVEIAVSVQTAPWSLADSDGGVYTGTGNRTLTGVPSGLLTMTWQPLAAYATPSPTIVTRELVAGGTAQFIGNYTPAGLNVDFAAFPPSGVMPLDVRFENRTTSPGANISYRWYFGDGETSTQPSPTHVYKKEGLYTVSLVATDYNEIKMTTKKHFVEVHAGVPLSRGPGLIALIALLMAAGLVALRARREGVEQ
jgi:PKD repeat protein